MKMKFPLYARILFWFFLNVLFLCAAFFAVARVQFKFGLDSLISGPAGDRLQSVTQLLTAELRDRPQSEWDKVLGRFSEASHVQFFLFGKDGEQIAGMRLQLPPEVRARVVERRRLIP